MAIKINWANVNVFPPGGSGLYMPFGPEWEKHSLIALSHNMQGGDIHNIVAMLRALRNVRIISGVRFPREHEIYIDARLPQDG